MQMCLVPGDEFHQRPPIPVCGVNATGLSAKLHKKPNSAPRGSPQLIPFKPPTYILLYLAFLPHLAVALELSDAK